MYITQMGQVIGDLGSLSTGRLEFPSETRLGELPKTGRLQVPTVTATRIVQPEVDAFEPVPLPPPRRSRAWMWLLPLAAAGGLGFWWWKKR